MFFLPNLGGAKLLRRALPRAIAGTIAGLALVLLAACAFAPPGEVLSGALPPMAPGTARLVFYRDLSYYDTQAMPTLYLNGVPSGVTQNGAVLIRDVPPGQYFMSVAPSLPYPNQFKTVVARAGDIFYVNIGTLPDPGCADILGSDHCWGNTFILSVVDPAYALVAIQGLRLLRG